MLDAAACGLPLIVNDTLVAVVKQIEGNGITYRLNDVDDLIRALLAARFRGKTESWGHWGTQNGK